MPTKINRKPCAFPMCKEITAHKYCENHQELNRINHNYPRIYKKETRPTFRQRGYDQGWKLIRQRILDDCPYCKNCGELALEVHHIPRYKIGTNHADYMLIPLCKSCHSKETRRESDNL